MTTEKTTLYPELQHTVNKIIDQPIPEERKILLDDLRNYIEGKIGKRKKAVLNFICTHNSRRSQFSQIWAQTAADYHQIPVKCLSGGVEVTSFNPRAVASLKRFGFKITAGEKENPNYLVSYSPNNEPVMAFSKLYDAPHNESDAFAAIMTCSHADDNCPFIPGAEKRIPLLYEDPKEFDGTEKESAKYDERSLQIAAEMFYLFSKIKK